MTTITERFKAIEAEEAKTQTSAKSMPASFIFQTKSGTKDIVAKFNIGGNYTKKKKVIRNPIPIFKGDIYFPDYEKNKDNTSRPQKTPIEAARGVVNITKLEKIANTDTNNTQAKTTKVFGLYRMGGAGIESSGSSIMKLEELKLLKDATDTWEQKNVKSDKGKWKGGI